MKRTVTVCIGEDARVVGSLFFDAQRGKETAAFAYDPTWIAAPDAFPIEPQLPLREGAQFPVAVGDASELSTYCMAIGRSHRTKYL